MDDPRFKTAALGLYSFIILCFCWNLSFHSLCVCVQSLGGCVTAENWHKGLLQVQHWEAKFSLKNGDIPLDPLSLEAITVL